MKKNLQDRAKEMGNSLVLMQGREKGELDRIINTGITIIEYGFLNDGAGKDYVAFIVKEDSQYFYFGGQVLTDNMHEFEEDGYHEEIIEKGLPALLGKKKSKNGMTYTTVTFFPEPIDPKTGFEEMTKENRNTKKK